MVVDLLLLRTRLRDIEYTPLQFNVNKLSREVVWIAFRNASGIHKIQTQYNWLF
jgi:hypothetical protein